ncbi:MAG: HisA/HisF-related TIM barrel protein, partial [Euryarchaeota archaeon]|nr:HisA/HisF-related TIM barrel protein [Euryarchaeota archaeon]
MRIIPVLDLIGGLVVCGQKGERSKYRPIRSIFCNSADPLEIVKAMKPKELYIADLDAIEMKGSNLDIINKIKFYNDIFLIVDAGFKSLLEVNNYLAAGIDKIIFGTETLTDINLLKQANEKFGREKILVSMDMKNGKILSKIQEFQHISPIKLATYMQHFVHELILLDISRVGTLVGSDTNLVRSIVKA